MNPVRTRKSKWLGSDLAGKPRVTHNDPMAETPDREQPVFGAIIGWRTMRGSGMNT